MRKEEKTQFIEELTQTLKETQHFYIADSSGLTVAQVNKLRTLCYKKNIKMQVIKNTLLRIAMEKSGIDYGDLYKALHGPTAVFFTEENNAPAKLIKEYRGKQVKPLLKGAWVEECTYLGDDQLEALTNVKTKNQLIGEIIYQLQSPASKVISALQNGGHTIAGILKTMSEKE